MQAPNLRTPSFLDSPPNTSTPACVSLSFNGSNWIDHQGIKNFFSLKTLSLCEGELLEDLVRDSHKPQYEQQILRELLGTKPLNTKGDTRGTLISLSSVSKT